MHSGQATRGSFAMAVREYQTTFELLPDVVNVLNEIRDADSGSRVHQAVCGPSFLDIIVIVLQMEALERHIAACQALIDRLPVVCSDPAEQMQSLAMLRDVLESKRSAPLSVWCCGNVPVGWMVCLLCLMSPSLHAIQHWLGDLVFACVYQTRLSSSS